MAEDLAKNLRAALATQIQQPLQPKANTPVQDNTDSQDQSISARKRGRLAKRVEAKRAALQGPTLDAANNLDKVGTNPLKGISRDADSLNKTPGELVGDNLGLDPFLTEQRALVDNLDAITSASLDAVDAQNQWEDNPAYQQKLIAQSDWVSSSDFFASDGDSLHNTNTGEAFRLYGVDTYETAKPEHLRLTNAEMYNNSTRKANKQYSDYIGNTGQDIADFKQEDVYRFGQNAKDITAKWFSDNPTVKQITILGEDKSGRGATLSDFVSPSGEKLSDVLRYNPEVNANFFHDQKAIAEHARRESAKLGQAGIGEGLLGPQIFDESTRPTEFIEKPARLAATGVSTVASGLIGGGRGVVEGFNTLGAKLFANNADEKLKIVDEAKAKLKDAKKNADFIKDQETRGKLNLLDDAYAMSAIQKRFRDDPKGDFSDNELKALTVSGVNVSYKAFDDNAPSKEKFKDLPTTFNKSTLNNPRVKTLLGDSLSKALFDKKRTRGTPVDLETVLSATREATRQTRSMMSDLVKSTSYLTDNAQKHITQHFDDVKEEAIFAKGIRDLQNGKILDTAGSAQKLLTTVVYDGLESILTHPTATAETISTSLGSLALVVANAPIGTGIMFSDTLNKQVTDARVSKGSELSELESLFVTGTAIATTALEATMARYLVKGGTRLTPAQIIANDTTIVRHGILSGTMARNIINTQSKGIMSTTVSGFKTTTDKVISMGMAGFNSRISKAVVDPVVSRILNPKTALGKLSYKAIGTTANFGYAASIMSAAAGRKGVLWAAKKAQALPRWGRTKTGLAMLADYAIATHGEAIEEGFTQYLSEISKNLGDHDKVNVQTILSAAREGSAAGSAIKSIGVAKTLYNRKKYLEQKKVNDSIVELAYSVVNATPTKIRERVYNASSPAYDVNKSYDLLTSTDYVKVLEDSDVTQSDVTRDIGSVQVELVKELGRLKNAERSYLREERDKLSDELQGEELISALNKIKSNNPYASDISAIQPKLDNLKDFKSNINQYFTASIAQQATGNLDRVINSSDISNEDFSYVTSANKITTKSIEDLNETDIQSATNLLSSLKLKRDTALNKVPTASTTEQRSSIEATINEEYNRVETRLKTTIKKGTQAVLNKRGLKDGRVIDTETVVSIDNSYSSDEVTKVDVNLQENLIPRTVDVFGSSRTDTREYRKFLEAIINNESLSPVTKQKASEMGNLLDTFDQSSKDLKELESDSQSESLALRSGENKTILTVFKDVLSATTNEAGKLGLKGHITRAFNAIASGKDKEAQVIIDNLAKWANTHQNKITKLSKAIAKAKKSKKGSTSVQLSDGGVTIEIAGNKTQAAEKLLRYMKNEKSLMDASYKAIVAQSKLTRKVAKRDSDTVNAVSAQTETESKLLLINRARSIKLSQYFNKINDTEFSTKNSKNKLKLITDRKSEIIKFYTKLKEQLDNSLEVANNGLDKSISKGVTTEIASVKNIIASAKSINNPSLKDAKVLSGALKVIDAKATSGGSVAVNAIIEINRRVALANNKVATDRAAFSLRNRKKSLSTSIKKLVKKGNSVQKSETALNTTLEAVQNNDEVDTRDLEQLLAHLKERDTKSPIQRASRAVVRKHFKNVSTVLSFLQGHSASASDIRAIAGLVSDTPIDTLASLTSKLNDLKLKDKAFVTSLISDLIFNEANDSIVREKVDLKEEKLKQLDFNPADKLNGDSSVQQAFLKSIYDTLGKDHTLTALLLTIYSSKGKEFDSIMDTVLTFTDKGNITSKSTKQLRSLFDLNGSTDTVTDKQIFNIMLGTSKNFDNLATDKFTSQRVSLVTTKTKARTKDIFKRSSLLLGIIDNLVKDNILSPIAAKKAKNKYKAWLRRNNQIRIDSDAYHTNKGIEKAENIVAEVGLSLEVASIIEAVIADIVEKEVISDTDKIAKRKLTEQDKTTASTTASIAFINEYVTGFSPFIENIVSITGISESLINLSKALQKSKIINQFAKLKKDIISDKARLREYNNLVKTHLHKDYRVLITRKYSDAKSNMKELDTNADLISRNVAVAEMFYQREIAAMQGDVVKVRKINAKISVSSSQTVSGFMALNKIKGLKSPVVRAAINDMLNGKIFTVKELSKMPQLSRAVTLYNDLVSAYDKAGELDANSLILSRARDSVIVSDRTKVYQKINRKLLRSGFDDTIDSFNSTRGTIDDNYEDRIDSFGNKFDNFNNIRNMGPSDRVALLASYETVTQPSTKSLKDYIKPDKDNTSVYNGIVSRIVSLQKANTYHLADVTTFYQVLFKNGAINEAYMIKRIQSAKKNGLNSSSTTLSVLLNDHFKVTGLRHVYSKQLHQVNMGTARQAGGRSNNKPTNIKTAKKLLKVNSTQALKNLTDLKTSMLETSNNDFRDTNNPTSIESLRSTQAYNLLDNKRKHFDGKVITEVREIIQELGIDLKDYTHIVTENNRENAPNSVVLTADMFEGAVPLDEAPLFSKLYGLFDSLSNSDNRTSLLQDINTKDSLESLRDNIPLLNAMTDIYKDFSKHSDTIYGNIANSKELGDILPDRLTEASEDPLRAFYNKDTGKIHNEILEAGVVAFFSIYASEMRGNVDLSLDSAKSLIGLKKEALITNETYAELRSKGTSFPEIAQRTGKMVTTMLNLKLENAESFADGLLQEKLESAIGNYILQIAQKSGYVDTTTYKNSEIDALKRSKSGQVLGTLSTNPNASTIFMHVKGNVDSDGVRQLPPKLEILSDLFSQEKGRKFLTDLASVNYTETYTTTKPSDNQFGGDMKVKKGIPGQNAPKAMRNMAKIASQTPWVINTNVRQGMANFGATLMDIINKVEDPNDFIEVLRTAKEGKVRSVQSSIEYISEIVTEFDEGTSEVHYLNTVIRNLRVAQESGGPRTDKNIRILMEQKDTRLELDVHDPDQFLELQAAMAVAFDVEYSNTWDSSMNENFHLTRNSGIKFHKDLVAFFELNKKANKSSILLTSPETELRPPNTEKLVDADGKVIGKQLYDLTANERTLFYSRGEVTKKAAGWVPYTITNVNKVSKADSEVLKSALKLTDGGHLGFQALMELYNIWDGAKKKGVYKVEVYQPREVDGKTHGPVAVSWNLASGMLNNMDSLTEVTSTLMSGGIATDRQIDGLYEALESGTKDNYNKLGDVSVANLSSYLARSNVSDTDANSTKAIIEFLSTSSLNKTISNTAETPNADKVKAELERDFFKFILIASIYGSSIEGIIDGKVDALEKLVYARYSEIRNTHPDSRKAELKAFNVNIVKMFGENTQLPKTVDDITNFQFDSSNINFAFELMNSAIAPAVKSALDTRIGSALTGMSIYNKVASVKAIITKAQEEKFTNEAIAKKASKLRVKLEHIQLSKTARDAILKKVVSSNMMAGFDTPSTSNPSEQMMYMDQEVKETSIKGIVKDKTGNGIVSNDSKGNPTKTASRELTLSIKGLAKETSVLPAMVQAMVIDSNIMATMFEHYAAGRLSAVDHVYDALMIPILSYAESKNYINPGEAMNKALWETMKWDYHKSMDSKLNSMLSTASKEGLDIQEDINNILADETSDKVRKTYKAVLLKSHNIEKELRLIEIDTAFLKDKDQKIVFDSLDKLAKQDAEFQNTLESGTSSFTIWRSEVEMHSLDISLSKNAIALTAKTIDGFPDRDSAFQVQDSSRPSKLDLNVLLGELKNNAIAIWNLENPNSTPIKTIMELSTRLRRSNNTSSNTLRLAKEKFKVLKNNSKHRDKLKKTDTDYKIYFAQHAADTGKGTASSVDVYEQENIKPKKIFRNNVSNQAYKFSNTKVELSKSDIDSTTKLVLEKHNYKTMPSKTAQEQAKRRRVKLANKGKLQQLLDSKQKELTAVVHDIDKALAFAVRNERLTNAPEVTDINEAELVRALKAAGDSVGRNNTRVDPSSQLDYDERSLRSAYDTESLQLKYDTVYSDFKATLKNTSTSEFTIANAVHENSIKSDKKISDTFDDLLRLNQELSDISLEIQTKKDRLANGLKPIKIAELNALISDTTFESELETNELRGLLEQNLKVDTTNSEVANINRNIEKLKITRDTYKAVAGAISSVNDPDHINARVKIATAVRTIELEEAKKIKLNSNLNKSVTNNNKNLAGEPNTSNAQLKYSKQAKEVEDITKKLKAAKTTQRLNYESAKVDLKSKEDKLKSVNETLKNTKELGGSRFTFPKLEQDVESAKVAVNAFKAKFKKANIIYHNPISANKELVDATKLLKELEVNTVGKKLKLKDINTSESLASIWGIVVNKGNGPTKLLHPQNALQKEALLLDGTHHKKVKKGLDTKAAITQDKINQNDHKQLIERDTTKFKITNEKLDALAQVKNLQNLIVNLTDQAKEVSRRMAGTADRTVKELLRQKLKSLRDQRKTLKIEENKLTRNIANKFGSTPGQVKLGIQRSTHEVNGTNVIGLFDTLNYTGGKVENSKHKTYLRQYVSDTLAPLLSALDESIELNIHEGGDTNSGTVTGATIDLNFTYKQSRYSSHDMSQEEVYAHEFSHIFWSVMSTNTDKAGRTYDNEVAIALRETQELAAVAIKEVMAKEGLPPEAIFYPRNSLGQVEFYHSESNEKLVAKEKFDYIFYSKNGVQEFAVFSETNETVRNAFDQHKLINPNSRSIKGMIKDIWNKILTLLSIGSGVGTIKNGQTINARMREIKRYAKNQHMHNIQKQTAKETFNDRANSAVIKFIADKITKPYTGFIKRKYTKGNISKVGKKTRAALGIPFLLLSKQFEAPIKQLYDSVFENRSNFAYQFFKEIKSNNSKKQGHSDLLYKGTAVNQRIHQNIINGTVRHIVEGFKDGKSFTEKDWDNLNDVMVRGEMQHVYEHMGITGLMEVLTSDKSLTDAITLYKHNIGLHAGSATNAMLHQAESLSNFTAHGQSTIRNHAMNTFVIAKQMMVPDSLKANISKANTKAIEKDLDVLVSLQHLATMEPTALSNAREILQNEYDSNRAGHNGITNMISAQHSSNKRVLASAFNGDKTLMERGHSTDTVNEHRKYIVAPLEKADELAKKYGMSLYKETYNGQGIFYSKFKTEQDWQNGSFAFSTEGTSKGLDIKDHYLDMYKGESITSIKDAALADIANMDNARNSEMVKLFKGQVPAVPRAKMIPIMSPNRSVVSYRVVMSHTDKRDILGMKSNAANSIAHNIADNVNKQRAKDTNTSIIDLIHEQWVNGSSDKSQKFIRLDKDSSDKEIAEISQMIPHNDWVYLQNKFGKGNPIMMTESLLPMVFGYRKGGLIETLNRTMDANMNKDLRNILHQSARLWQGSVSEWKRVTVLLTPSTFINNLLSNTVVLKLRGLSGSDSVRGQLSGLKHMNKYIQDTDELIKLQLKQQQGNATTNEVSRIDALVRHIVNNPVKELVDGGAFSPNVEDITLSENKILTVLKDVVPSTIKDTMKDVSETIPKPIKTVANNLFITRDTVASDLLTHATQVSDFVGRYALYQKLLKDGTSKEEAVKAVITQFVSYDENTSMPIQWLNDNGLWNFSKYALRSAKTVTDLYAEKPANMMMYHMLDGLTDSTIASPTQGFIGFNGINVNGVSVGDVATSPLQPHLMNYLPAFSIF